MKLKLIKGFMGLQIVQGSNICFRTAGKYNSRGM